MDLEPIHLWWFWRRLEVAVYDTNAEYREEEMALKDRLREKALQAKSITANAVKELEDAMDSIIAEGPAIAQKRDAALAAHNDALGAVKGEWDSIKSAVDILHNGAPEFDDENKTPLPPLVPPVRGYPQ